MQQQQQQQQQQSLQCNNCSVPAVGQLTPTLGNMTALATVNLQGNRFYGTLPTGWGGPNQFPALQNMYLNDNNLTGTLPNEWGAAGAFPALLLIRLDSNRLSGTLPGSWGSENGGMPAMLVMRLFNNSLEGTLPVEWGRPAAFGGLNILALQINRLTGSIPEEWWTPGALPRLQELYLQTNKISGPLPDAWGRPDAFPDLTYLFLSRNPVGGTLPPEWGGNNSFPNLKVMALNDTQLTGTLPPEWGSGQGFQKLDALWLERNNLTGTIPPEWAGFEPLQRLIIRPGNPHLCGPIPPNLPFSLCDDSDVSCARVVPSLDGPNCPVLPPPSPGEVPSPPGATPPSPGGPPAPPSPGGGDNGGETSGGGGSSFPVAAVAAPVAAAAVIAAALAAFLVRRRRRRRAEEEAKARGGLGGSPSDRPFYSEPPPHPFDTEAGRDLATSPFAAGALRTSMDGVRASGGDLGGSSGSGQATSSTGGASKRGVALAMAGGITTSGKRLHDSGRSTHSSAGSYLSACHRIKTKSLDNVGQAALPPPAELQLGDVAQQGSAPAPEPSEAPTGVPTPPLHRASSSEDFVMAMMSGLPSGSTPGASSSEASRAFSSEMPWSDWEIRPDEIEVMKRPDGSDWELGTGGFGKVFKALRNGVQPVAVKVLLVFKALRIGVQPVAVKVLLASSDLRQMAMAEFRKEIAILKACRDVNIVQFVGAHISSDKTMLVTEYMEGGNLSTNIAAGRVSWYRRGRKIALDVAKGLVFLHSKRIIHFDLKSPNILLGRDGTAKIADVGMAKVLQRDYVTGVVGTLAWAAPEMLWGERCTERADMYSYGIVLWEICSGERPVRGQLRDVRVPEECPPEVRQLILECLETRPSRRPSALQVVQRLLSLPAAVPPNVQAALAAAESGGRASPPASPIAPGGSGGSPSSGGQLPVPGSRLQPGGRAQQAQQRAQGVGPGGPGATILTTRGSVKLPVDSPLIMGDVGVAGARRSSDLSRSGGTHSGTQESQQTTISGSVASPVSGAGAAGAAFAAQPPLRQQQVSPLRQQQVSPLRRRASLQPRLASAIAAASSDENVSGDRGSSTASEYWASLHDTSGVPPPTEGWSRDNSLGAVPPGAADAARQHRSGDSTGPRPSRLGGAFAFPDSPGGTQAQGPRPGWQNSGGSVGLASPFGQAMAQEQPRSPESSEYLSGSTLRSGAGGAEQPQQAEQPQRAQQQQQQQQGAQVAWGQPEETPEGYIEVLPAQSAPPPQQQQ
ncbi:hypothetical protein N2152v2_001596 [Parachlorella kessleri]